MKAFEYEGEGYMLTSKAIETVKEIARLYRDTKMTFDEIAVEVGLDTGDTVRLLWYIADQTGLLDTLGL
jgi:hypothetical protein